MAVVEPGAELGAGVVIGPFCHIEAGAAVGDRVELSSHVVVHRGVTVGEDCKVSSMAILGGPPQNTKHKGGPTTLVIGRNCTIREGVTMHRGTDTSRGETTVGDNGNFLAYSHIAHDCVVGDNVTMANNSTLGGHVEIGDWVTIGGLTGIHQFVKVGAHAMVGFASAVSQDVPPFMLVDGNPLAVRGVNVVGLKRRGFSDARIAAVRKMHKLLYREGRTLDDAKAAIGALAGEVPEAAEDVALMGGFLAAAARGIAR